MSAAVSMQTAPFTGAALEIASALRASAVEVPGGLAWHGPVPLATDGDELETAIMDTGRDLYSGSAGIGLFLAAAAGFGGDRSLADTARAALGASLLSASQSLPTGPLGLLDGAAGIAWASVEAGRLLDDADLTAAGTGLMTRAAEATLDRGATAFDVTVGDAGVILALLAVAGPSEVGPSVGAVAARLAGGGQPAAWGRAWPDPRMGPGNRRCSGWRTVLPASGSPCGRRPACWVARTSTRLPATRSGTSALTTRRRTSTGLTCATPVAVAVPGRAGRCTGVTVRWGSGSPGCGSSS